MARPGGGGGTAIDGGHGKSRPAIAGRHGTAPGVSRFPDLARELAAQLAGC